MLERLAQTGQDTARVHALYAIADHHWRKDAIYDSIISYRYREEGEIVLEISDNGIGIDRNIKDKTLNSLGVELMKGLSEDISGQIEFASDEGTRITVRFIADAVFYPAVSA